MLIRYESDHQGTLLEEHYEIMFDEVVLWRLKVDFASDLKLKVKIDLPAIRMVFSLNANVLYENYSGGNEIFSFSPNQHNIIFSSSNQGNLSIKASPGTELVEITLPPDFILKYLSPTPPFGTFRRSIEHLQFSMLSPYGLPVTAEMKVVLKEILTNQKTPEIKRLLLEAKTIELLMLQLEQYEQTAGNTICINMRRTDIQKMHQVRTIIDNSWNEPCSLIDLAQQVMTNEYNLKKSFKEVFGTTIFGYLGDVKMNEAKRLLLKGEKSISQIADIVGYKNANHFTTAFKRHFGIVPSDLK